MPEKLFNSPIQRLLVTLHKTAATRFNLHNGRLGWLYQRLYFFYKRVTDRRLVATARKLARPGTLVVDVGANVGFFSATLARHADVTLIAFEPDLQNCLDLAQTVSNAGLDSRIRSYRLALSDKTGAGLLYISDLAPTDHKLINSRSSRTIEIETMRLDDFFVRHPDLSRKPISLIKIDVQGAELQVLQGMLQTLAKNDYPPILIEYSPDDLAHAGVTPVQFFNAFEELGYVPHVLPELSSRGPDWFIENTRGAYQDLAMIHCKSP